MNKISLTSTEADPGHIINEGKSHAAIKEHIPHNMTLTLTEVLLIVIALCCVTILIVCVRFGARIARTAAEVDALSRYIDSIRPSIDRLLRDAELEMSELRQVTQRADRIAEDIQDISAGARQVTRSVFTQLAAVLTGAKVGLQVFQRRRSSRGFNGNGQ
jgi:uncharacterized protein YoxC